MKPFVSKRLVAQLSWWRSLGPTPSQVWLLPRHFFTRGSCDCRHLQVEKTTLRSDDNDENTENRYLQVVVVQLRMRVMHVQSWQQLCTCITLFCTLLCHNCSTGRANTYFHVFIEDVNKGRRNFLFLSQVGYSSEEFNSKRVSLHLTK